MPPSPRSDARRNRDAVLAAALRLLAADPEATMGAVADASGLTRTTVYRHFPSRETLLRALFGVVAREADAAAAEATAGDPPLEQVAAAVARSSIALGERFRFLAGHDALADEAAQSGGEQEMARWLAVARERGEVRDDVPIAWQLRIARVIGISAVELHNGGGASAREAQRLMTTTLVAALGERSPDGRPAFG